MEWLKIETKVITFFDAVEQIILIGRIQSTNIMPKNLMNLLGVYTQ